MQVLISGVERSGLRALQALLVEAFGFSDQEDAENTVRLVPPDRLREAVQAAGQCVLLTTWRAPAAVIASYQFAHNAGRPQSEYWYMNERSSADREIFGAGLPVSIVDFERLLEDPLSVANSLVALTGVSMTRPGAVLDAIDGGRVNFDATGRWRQRAVQRKLGEWGRVAVGLRTANGPRPSMFSSYQALLHRLRPGDVLLDLAANLPSHWAADKLAREFLVSGCDSLLMLDDDMVFRPDDLDKLRDSSEGKGYDILSAWATRRQWPPRPITMRRLKYQPPFPMAQAGAHYAHVLQNDAGGGTVFRADMTGLAFTLIRRHVLLGMVNEWGPQWTSFFPYELQQSDDAAFCIRAKAMGCEIGVSLEVPIGHVGDWVYGQEDFARWIAQVNQALAETLGGGDAPATP